MSDKDKKKSKEKDKKKEKLNETRTYDISSDEGDYSLKVEVDHKYLRFIAHEINDTYKNIFKNKYELHQLIKKLNLVNSKYTSFSKLFKFMDTAYEKDKISIEQKTDNDLYINFEVPVDFEEERYSLHLKKKKLDDSEMLPILMEQINRLNNNNTIVRNKFIEIERQINSISRKSSAKQGSAKTNINQELYIIKKQLNDINGKLNINNNKYNTGSIRKKSHMLKSSINTKPLNNFNNNLNISNKKKYKSIQLDNKNRDNFMFYKNIMNNKKYNNQRYEIKNEINDNNEDEKEESSEVYINNNKIEDKRNNSNKKRTLKRNTQININEIKRSSRYIKNNEEEKYEEKNIEPKFRNTNRIKIMNEQEGMINNIENSEMNNNINSSERTNLIKDDDQSEFSENNIKINRRRITYINKNQSELEEYNNKTKVAYTSIPIKLKYKMDITTKNTSCGWNDMFEVYISYLDNKDYLASPNYTKFNIDIYLLEENKKEASLKGHKNNIRTIRYFFHKNNNILEKKENEEKNVLVQEYLISADDDKIVIVWDLLNNYEIKHLIDTNYDDDIYSCALFFNQNIEKNYIITSTYCTSSDITNSTKLYSLDTGEFAYYIKESNFDNIYYLLIWLNPKNNQYYIIQFSYKKILINNLSKGNDEIYAKLSHEPENEHYSGYIYSKDKTDFLVSTCYNGFVYVWDLFAKNIVNIIDTKIILCHVIQWSEKYAIAADYENKSFVIIDLDEKNVFNGSKNAHKLEVKCVKKIVHSTFGECLITAGRDNAIKLWVT